MKKTNRKTSRHSIAHSRAHIKRLHHARIGLFSLLLLALVVVRGDGGIVQTAAQPQANGNVLAYATSMSRTDLLNATNAFRAQNGLGPLNLNGQLNTSAQNKAQHMVTHDYWSHNAPDGTTPWYFFDQAGYYYTKAGENLAYGFNTSQDAVDGWIGSPGHRANMLGEYQDVGFGFVDGPNYQGGPYTVVVAHYGATAAPAPPPPAPAPVAPATTTPAPTAPTPTPTEAPTPTPAETKQPTSESTPDKSKESAKPTKPATTPPVTVASTQNVTLLEQLQVGKPRLASIVSTMLVMSIAVGFVLTHRSFVRHAAIVGEKFVLAHPAMDATVIVAVVGLILSTTVGRIG